MEDEHKEIMTGAEGDTVRALTSGGLSSRDDRRHLGPCRQYAGVGSKTPQASEASEQDNKRCAQHCMKSVS
jgi:hypothetical protein